MKFNLVRFIFFCYKLCLAYGQTFGPNSDAFVPFEFCPYGEFSSKGDSRYRKAVFS